MKKVQDGDAEDGQEDGEPTDFFAADDKPNDRQHKKTTQDRGRQPICVEGDQEDDGPTQRSKDHQADKNVLRESKQDGDEQVDDTRPEHHCMCRTKGCIDVVRDRAHQEADDCRKPRREQQHTESLFFLRLLIGGLYVTYPDDVIRVFSDTLTNTCPR